jgi:hypothetical protein
MVRGSVVAHLVYVDDSRDEALCAFSALVVPVSRWHEAFGRLRDFRKVLKTTDGIYIHKELHATDFVAGRSRVSPQVVTKFRRAQIFEATLKVAASLPEAKLLNAVFPRKDDETALEWLLNRVNRMMEHEQSHALLVLDEGKNDPYTRLRRRMGVHNPIPSQYGRWADGGTSKNLPLTRIVEDPFFKSSGRSYFIQVVDFCAFALLRRERPTEHTTAYGIDKMFAVLSGILNLQASRSDPDGIIRPPAAQKSRAYTRH